MSFGMIKTFQIAGSLRVLFDVLVSGCCNAELSRSKCFLLESSFITHSKWSDPGVMCQVRLLSPSVSSVLGWRFHCDRQLDALFMSHPRAMRELQPAEVAPNHTDWQSAVGTCPNVKCRAPITPIRNQSMLD
jgi:hypothetical protein